MRPQKGFPPRRACPGVRRHVLLFAALILLVAAPLASGKTLSDFEEPHGGENAVIEFDVTREEAGRPRLVVFLNPPSEGFGLIVYRADGSEAYVRNGTRGIQPFPALTEGSYKFFLRGNGLFLLTDRHLDRSPGGNLTITDVNETLRGRADTYVLVPTRNWTLHLEGEGMDGLLFDLRGGGANLNGTTSKAVIQGVPYVLALRGAEGETYRLRLEPREGGVDNGDADPTPTPAATNDAPGPGLLLVAGALGVAAASMRGLRRRT